MIVKKKFVRVKGRARFSCFFLRNIKCSFRKSQKFGIMNRCLTCPHYKRFMNEMAEEEAKEDARMEDILKNPEKYGYSRE